MLQTGSWQVASYACHDGMMTQIRMTGTKTMALAQFCELFASLLYRAYRPSIPHIDHQKVVAKAGSEQLSWVMGSWLREHHTKSI